MSTLDRFAQFTEKAEMVSEVFDLIGSGHDATTSYLALECDKNLPTDFKIINYIRSITTVVPLTKIPFLDLARSTLDCYVSYREFKFERFFCVRIFLTSAECLAKMFTQSRNKYTTSAQIVVVCVKIGLFINRIK